MNCNAYGQKYILIALAILTIVFGSAVASDLHAYAQNASENTVKIDSGSKLIGAGMAFGLGSGWFGYRSWIRRCCRACCDQ